MEKYQHMKAFNVSAREYSRHHNEKAGSALQRHLQILGVTSDMSVFDPGSSVAAEFYVSLHELMNGLESRSSLVWCAISVLQHACRNPAARAALIHTFKFTPILTRLLGVHLILEKRIRVLQLLQELTYGIKISWQEAHLPYLISTLAGWITENESDVVRLSLGVLVNLCYKNLPAIYTLMRSVDSKQFLRTVLKLQNDNISTRVQVCKLLIILEHISGEIPEIDLLNFANVTFSTLGEAFRSKDVFLLRHIVNFFVDVQGNSHSRDVLLTYPSYRADTECLLAQMDQAPDPECVGMLFEFLHSLVALKVESLYPLHPKLVEIAMKWIHTELACTQSLALIRTIAVGARKDQLKEGTNIHESVLAQLDKDLCKLLVILQTGGDESFPTNSETRNRLTALLQLLQEMCKNPVLRQKILTSVNYMVVNKIFQPLLSLEPWEGENLFQNEVVALYVQTLDFMSDLASHDSNWMRVYSNLLEHKQVQMVLAAAVYTGSENIKHQVLTLTGTVGFPAESVAALAKSLCDLEPLVMVTPNNHVKTLSSGVVQQDMTQLFSLAQESRLDHFIAKLEEALERNEIADVPMSAIMELYEYKLAAMGHSERTLQASLEAANNHSTHLQHRLAQTHAEAGRLHQLLYHNQQALEGLRQETQALSRKVKASDTKADEAHRKYVKEAKSKQKIVNELNSTIDEIRNAVAQRTEELEASHMREEVLKKQVEDITNELRNMESKYKDQTIKNSDLTKMLSKLEDRIGKRDKKLEEKDSEISKLSKDIHNLKAELSNLDLLCKGQEKNLTEKDAELTKTQAQLTELQRMREVIFEISAGRKKMDK